MHARGITTGILLVVAGLSLGWLAGSRYGRRPGPDAVADAKAAIEELVAYRGLGARAARHTFLLVDRIVAGGSAVVPAIGGALPRVSKTHRYTSHGDQAAGIYEMDTRNGIISRYPNATVALLEALARIGTDEAIGILMAEAVRQEGKTGSIDRQAAVLFLSRFADRPEVRELFTKIVLKTLVTHGDGPEAQRVLEIAKGRLEPRAFEPLARAFTEGWARGAMPDRVAAGLYAMDPAKAAKLFLELLAEETKPMKVRRAAARSIARIPKHRQAAAELILAKPDLLLVNDFVLGLRRGRFGEEWLWRDAAESGDPERVKAYDLGRLPLLAEALALIRQFAEAVGPDGARRIDLPKRIREFTDLIRAVKKHYPEAG